MTRRTRPRDRHEVDVVDEGHVYELRFVVRPPPVVVVHAVRRRPPSSRARHRAMPTKATTDDDDRGVDAVDAMDDDAGDVDVDVDVALRFVDDVSIHSASAEDEDVARVRARDARGSDLRRVVLHAVRRRHRRRGRTEMNILSEEGRKECDDDIDDDVGDGDTIGVNDVTLLYGGKVLRDDDDLREAFKGSSWNAHAMSKENGARKVVVHVVVRRLRDRANANVEASASANASGERTRTNEARDADARAKEGNEDAHRDVRTRASGDGVENEVRRNDASAWASADERSSANARASAGADVRLTARAVDYLPSPGVNAMYHAAYHAAYAALSPNAARAPGPPPLAPSAFGGFLNASEPARVAQFGAPGSWAENDGRANAQQFAPEQNVHANIHRDLPPGLNIPPGARVRVIHIRIDLKLIFKLAMMVFFLSQEASTSKFMMYIMAAILVYMQQTGALAAVARWIAGNAGEHAGNNRGANDGGANNNNANNRGGMGGIRNREDDFVNQGYVPPTRATHAWGHVEMPRSLVGEVKILLYSFLASIFPTWLPPRLHQAQRAHQE